MGCCSSKKTGDPTLQTDIPEGDIPEGDIGTDCVVTVPSHSTSAEEGVNRYRLLSTLSTIRLIEVMRDKVDGCIACKIHTFDVQQHSDIKYKALSYVWGDPVTTRQVFLADDGDEHWKPYPLHESLWLFLDSTWQKESFGQLLWTDYLCFNQNDQEEIAQQIPGWVQSIRTQIMLWRGLS